MGLLSASCSFTRFKIMDEIPKELWPQIPELLKKYAFKEIEQSAEERGWGWVCFEDMLDSWWHTAPPEKGPYFAFSMRLDTRRIAPAVMKKHFTIALREEERQAKEQGRKFIGRDRKKEIKEQVRLKLMARSMPIPAVFEVVWSIENNIVYLATSNGKMQDMFSELFTETFDLHLEPFTPYGLALEILGEDAQKKLDEVEATRFNA